MRNNTEGNNGSRLDRSFYEEGLKSLCTVVNLVDAGINIPEYPIFHTKEERVEALFFLWFLVKKLLESKYHCTNINPCLVALGLSLKRLNIPTEESAVLVPIWAEERIDTYNHFDDSKWIQTLDFLSVWANYNGHSNATENNVPRLDLEHLGGIDERFEKQQELKLWCTLLFKCDIITQIAADLMKYEEHVQISYKNKQSVSLNKKVATGNSESNVEISYARRDSQPWQVFFDRNFQQNIQNNQNKHTNPAAIQKMLTKLYQSNIFRFILLVVLLVIIAQIKKCKRQQEAIKYPKIEISDIREPVILPSKSESHNTKGNNHIRPKTNIPPEEQHTNPLSNPKKGFGINQASQEALWLAIFESNETEARKAVANGADVNMVREEDGIRLAPLQATVLKQDYKMTVCLLSLRANINISTEELPNLWSVILKTKPTPENERILILLALNGLDPNIPALAEYDEAARSEILKGVEAKIATLPPSNYISQESALEELTENIDTVLQLGQMVKFPIVKMCVASGYKRALSYLLSKNVKVTTDEPLIGGGALHMAAEKGDYDSASLLLQHGATVDETELIGYSTPLHTAVEKQDIAMTKLLLAHGASVDAITNSELQPLHIAATVGSVPLLELLINNDAHIDFLSPSLGFSALRYALLHEQFDAAKYLIEKGANVYQADAEGVTDAMMILVLSEDKDPSWRSLLNDEQIKEALQGWKAIDGNKR